MKYRLVIFLKFFLVLVAMLFGTANSVQKSDPVPEEKKEYITSNEKSTSNNIHVDEIVIKNSTESQSERSNEEKTKLVYNISNDVEKEVWNWIQRQSIFGISIVLASIAGIWGFISRAVEKGIEKHVDKLDKKREEATDATTKAKHEIERTQKKLEELQGIENDLDKKLKDFKRKIEEEIKNKEDEICALSSKADSIRDNLKSIAQDLNSKVTDEISELQLKINALELIINKIDSTDKAKNEVISELIIDLKSSDLEKKYNATELLSQFKDESNKISDAFVEILKNKPDITFGSLLLSGLGELKGDGQTLSYLVELLKDISNPNILAIIGALGELGETELEDKEYSFIIENLLSILKDDLDKKELALDITPSNIKGAIALAMSCYGEKAVKAVNELINILAVQDDQVTRKNAVIALGKIGAKAKDAIPALRRLENDEYTEVRSAALDAIKEISQTA